MNMRAFIHMTIRVSKTIDSHHNSDDYQNVLYTTGTSSYWYEVNQYAQTKMDLDVYWWIFFVGHVSLECLVNPTQH